MPSRNLSVSMVLLATLAGCAEHWAKPGGTTQELQATKAACESESYARFPPVLQQILLSPGYFQPAETRCVTVNGQPQCQTIGGFWVPPTWQTIDVNLDGRRSARIACMTARGWILADSDKEAAAITASGTPRAVTPGELPPGAVAPGGPAGMVTPNGAAVPARPP